MTVRLHTRAYGAGPPLILLHGLFGSGRNWRSVGQRLADTFHVFTPDLRNHAASPWAESMTHADMADDVRRLIADNGLGDPVVLGHSMGGKVAMTLALESPELVRRLIVVDIAPVAYSDAFSDYVTAMRALDLAAMTSRRDVDAALSDAIPDTRVRQFLMQNLSHDETGLRWMPNLAALGDQMTAIKGFSATAGRQYEGPTLFVAGAESDYIRGEHRAGIRALFPLVRFVTVDNAGHWVHAEQPQHVIDIIRQFAS